MGNTHVVTLDKSKSEYKMPEKNNNSYPCDLCDSWTDNIVEHIRESHPGCQKWTEDGGGYNAKGEFRPEWSGVCSRGTIFVYLMCTKCRQNYKRMRQLSSGTSISTNCSPSGTPQGSCTVSLDENIKINNIHELQVH